MVVVNSQNEFDEKMNIYKTSSASFEQIENAIRELNRLNPQYSKTEKRDEKILREIKEGEADISDIGGF